MPPAPPLEGPSHYYLSPDAIERVAADIHEAGGTEVFFIGRRGPDGLVIEVESHAVGNERAVPVLMNLVEPGDVILHNHPSGRLDPSDADIHISSVLGNQGVGSLIVSNDALRVRVVVRPHEPREKKVVEPDAVERYLSPKSALASELEEYEDRPQQREMARAVTNAFNRDGIALVEAGTGTGKSLAYLVPAILYALENKEKVVVSTQTINLQEQILHKDLPVVRRALDKEFRAEIVKGRSNYVCKRKAQHARDELRSPQQLLIEDEFRVELREILEWASTSEYGDLSELPVTPRFEVWEKVVSETDNCLRLRCPFYEQCFYYNSRRRAARADVLVVNHSLLLSDIAVRRESGNWSAAAVLPPYRHVILDEAHHLEESATNHLGSRVTRTGVRRLFGRLLRSDKSGRRGALAQASDKIEELAQQGRIPLESATRKLLIDDILPSFESVRDAVDYHFEDFGYTFLDLARLSRPKQREEHRVRITPAIEREDRWEEELIPIAARLATTLTEYIDLNRAAIAGMEDFDEDALEAMTNAAMEWRAYVERLDGQRRLILQFLQHQEDVCRWMEFAADKRSRLRVRFCQAPVSVEKLLRQHLHDKMKTEVLTSATLTVDGQFEFLGERIGLRAAQDADLEPAGEKAEGEEKKKDAPSAARPVERLLLDAPFDYRNQVFFGVPNDLGDPRGEQFEDRFADLLVRAVSVSGGRAFLLFTSYAQMRRLHGKCAPLIERLGFDTLIQGEESRDRLLRRFRQDETSVLFATSSFWEGVDVRGRALELLVIARLPFSVPSEPIQEAQHEWMRAQGRDPFNGLTVPRAVIRLKQGFGRLIRSRADRGAVLVCDDRIVRMGYGRRFLKSLPEIDVRNAPGDHLLDEMREFLGGRPTAVAPP